MDLSKVPFAYSNLTEFKTALFIMRAAGDAPFPAATVFLLLIRRCGFGAWIG